MQEGKRKRDDGCLRNQEKNKKAKSIKEAQWWQKGPLYHIYPKVAEQFIIRYFQNDI